MFILPRDALPYERASRAGFTSFPFIPPPPPPLLSLSRSHAYLRCPVRSRWTRFYPCFSSLVILLAAGRFHLRRSARIVAVYLSPSLLVFSLSLSFYLRRIRLCRSLHSVYLFPISVAPPVLFVSPLRSLARFLASTLSVLVSRYFYLSFPTQKFAVSPSRPPYPTLSALSLSRCVRAIFISHRNIYRLPRTRRESCRVRCLSSTGSLSLSFCRSVRCWFPSLSLSLLPRRTFVRLSASLLRTLSFSHARHIRVVLTCRSFVLCRILLRSDSVSSSLFSSVCTYRLFLSVSYNHIVIRRLILASSDVPRCLFSLLGALLSSRVSLSSLRAGVLYLPTPSARDGF